MKKKNPVRLRNIRIVLFCLYLGFLPLSLLVLQHAGALPNDASCVIRRDYDNPAAAAAILMPDRPYQPSWEVPCRPAVVEAYLITRVTISIIALLCYAAMGDEKSEDKNSATPVV
jgi:hypothetical protein